MVITHGGTVFATARERGLEWRNTLDFSASINPLGPAPGVRQAILNAVDEIVHYPDPYSARLVQALAEEWNVEPECILTGNGATDLIHYVARTWDPGRVTLAVPTFSEFHRAWPGAKLVRKGDQWPEDGLLVLTNPNNPTGLPAQVPERTGWTLVDESFIDFTTLPTAIGSRHLVLRSLTKFQAIPGLRVGALVGPAELMRRLRTDREPWQVNVLAEAAAVAALRDREHARITRQYVAAEAVRLWGEVSRLVGVRPFKPAANYIFAALDYPAARLADHMLANQILIRVCTGMAGVDGEAVRFAVRTRPENDRLLECWSRFPC